MDHWFDDLARGLARQSFSRRSMLSWTAKLGVAAAGTALLGRNPPVAGAAQASAAPARSTCKVEDSYGVLKAVFTTSSPPGSKLPLTLSHTFTAEVASGVTSSTLTVKSGNDVVQRTSTTSLANRAASAHVTYGSLYTGVRRAGFNTDGRTVQGFVDGRATESAPLEVAASGLKFKDGRPGPAAVHAAAPGLDQAVADLLRQARTQLVACRPDAKASQAVVACTRCQVSCRATWLRCSLESVQASRACGAFGPACYLRTANARCDAALQQCFRTCKSSGACCPSFCKGDAACCQSAWGCCPPSSNSRQTWSKVWPTCPRCGPPITPAPRPAPR